MVEECDRVEVFGFRALGHLIAWPRGRGTSPSAPRPQRVEKGTARRSLTAVRRALRERGYGIVPVTIDFDDWVWNDVYARCAGEPGGGSVDAALPQGSSSCPSLVRTNCGNTRPAADQANPSPSRRRF